MEDRTPYTRLKPEHHGGLKAEELRQSGPCGICGRGLMADRCITFYRLTVQQFVIDVNAVRRSVGLAMTLGSGDLARVMGPDEYLAVAPCPARPLIVCQTCAVSVDSSLGALIERTAEDPPAPADPDDNKPEEDSDAS